MIKTTTALATLLTGITLSTAAVGGEVANGRMANGISLNGISLNGIELNGRWLNSLSYNGMRVQGTQISGARMPGRPREDMLADFNAGSVVIEAIKLPANE